jgi:predicted nuclease with RNAse H fold
MAEEQRTELDKTIREVHMDRNEVEQLILAHYFMGYGEATFDWNEQTGAVVIQHIHERVKQS